MSVRLHHGDCRDVLATLPDASVDAVVTDPPYEISFMAKTWDGSGVAYDVDLWAEVLRVLKPGGHLLAFGGTRTYHRMTVAIEDAGFEIRDSLHWLYGSGFPKSLDVSKAIDKAAGAERPREDPQRRAEPSAAIAASGFGADGWAPQVKEAATEDAARQWEGWGTALKPAHEPIVVARKPLVGTVAGNVLAHGTGALNIDGCRVAMGDEYDPTKVQRQQSKGDGAIDGAFGAGALVGTEIPTYKPDGRWPANLVFTHAAECGEACAEGCPVAELDGQSGVSKSGAAGTKGSSGFAGGYDGDYSVPYGDTGGASRFFTVTEWDPIADVAPFRYVAKPSKRERNAGLDGLPERNREDQSSWVRECGTCGCRFTDPTTSRPKCEHDDVIYTAPSPTKNHHPTVKPVALMRWLVRLVTPPGGTVLDPFAGSGTTLAVATLEHFDAIGIELTADYLPIINGRIAWAEEQAQAQPATLFSQEAS